MDRLTKNIKFPLDTFKRCQLCGYASDEIVDFRMWNECDDNDKPEPNNVIVLCSTRKAGLQCNRVLDNHPRLYIEVPWGEGGPGIFMLLCGDCTFREKTSCKNPNLKSNGGEGLEVKFANLLPMRVCFADGTSRYAGKHPASFCGGKETKK